MVAEKTSELERCLSELQDILIALEAAESRNAELTHAEIFSNSLQEALSQRDMILQKCAQIMAILINTPYLARGVFVEVLRKTLTLTNSTLFTAKQNGVSGTDTAQLDCTKWHWASNVKDIMLNL
ncbi:hypothetical protein Tco_0014277 [Tanacetum coccineum]